MQTVSHALLVAVVLYTGAWLPNYLKHGWLQATLITISLLILATATWFGVYEIVHRWSEPLANFLLFFLVTIVTAVSASTRREIPDASVVAPALTYEKQSSANAPQPTAASHSPFSIFLARVGAITLVVLLLGMALTIAVLWPRPADKPQISQGVSSDGTVQKPLSQTPQSSPAAPAPSTLSPTKPADTSKSAAAPPPAELVVSSPPNVTAPATPSPRVSAPELKVTSGGPPQNATFLEEKKLTPTETRQQALRKLGERLSNNLRARLAQLGESEIQAPLVRRGFCRLQCPNDGNPIYTQIVPDDRDISPLENDPQARIPLNVSGKLRYDLSNDTRITLGLEWHVAASDVTQERLSLEVDSPAIDPAWREALYEILAARNVLPSTLKKVCSPDRRDNVSKDQVLACSMSNAWVKVTQQWPAQGIFTASLQMEAAR